MNTPPDLSTLLHHQSPLSLLEWNIPASPIGNDLYLWADCQMGLFTIGLQKPCRADTLDGLIDLALFTYAERHLPLEYHEPYSCLRHLSPFFTDAEHQQLRERLGQVLVQQEDESPSPKMLEGRATLRLAAGHSWPVSPVISDPCYHAAMTSLQAHVEAYKGRLLQAIERFREAELQTA